MLIFAVVDAIDIDGGTHETTISCISPTTGNHDGVEMIVLVISVALLSVIVVLVILYRLEVPMAQIRVFQRKLAAARECTSLFNQYIIYNSVDTMNNIHRVYTYILIINFKKPNSI